MRVALILFLTNGLIYGQNPYENSTGTDVLRGLNVAVAVWEKRADSIPVEELTDGMYWVGYVVGFYEAWVLNPSEDACLPETIQRPQLVLTVRKHLLDNPEILHLPGAFLVGIALGKVFPCPVAPTAP